MNVPPTQFSYKLSPIAEENCIVKNKPILETHAEMRVWVVLVLLFCAFTVSATQSKYKCMHCSFYSIMIWAVIHSNLVLRLFHFLKYAKSMHPTFFQRCRLWSLQLSHPNLLQGGFESKIWHTPRLLWYSVIWWNVPDMLQWRSELTVWHTPRLLWY